MKEKMKMLPWRIAALATGFTLISIVLVVVIVVGINDFEWRLFPQIFHALWSAFLMILCFVFLVVLVVTKYPLESLTIALLTTALLFIFGSIKEGTIGKQLGPVIYTHLDVNLFSAGITLVAFLLAVYAIRKSSSSNKD
ncbi:hypothetical protein ES703_62839 [subsurface metagenome]